MPSVSVVENGIIARARGGSQPELLGVGGQDIFLWYTDIERNVFWREDFRLSLNISRFKLSRIQIYGLKLQSRGRIYQKF